MNNENNNKAKAISLVKAFIEEISQAWFDYCNHATTRGWHDGDGISIELGEAFQAAEKYIVVISTASMGGGAENDLKKLLAKTKKFYENAYIREWEVYIGCTH